MSTYDSHYQLSITQPEVFWKEQAEKISWFKKPTKILGKNRWGYPIWFEDGEVNACYLAVDKHCEDGFGDQVAIYYDSPVTDTKEQITFNQLQNRVSKFAGGLAKLGAKKGDTVIIYMPMIPEALVAMLACARLGVTHSVVFGGFAPHELAIRIDDCSPKFIITASCGVEIQRVVSYKPMVDEAIVQATHKPEKVIHFEREIEGVDTSAKDYDVDFWTLEVENETINCVPLSSTHPLYILYTSGTTGKPKGIVRDTGGYATALNYSMKHIYGVKPGEVFWAASDVGWVVGHSYIVYAPLFHRNSTVLFEGKPIKTPDASTFWRIISEYKVSVMFTAPTAIRAIKKEDPDGDFIKKFDLSNLRYQFLAGERCDVATLEWYNEHIPVPAIDHWWQTESGWPMIANSAGVELLPIKPGSATKAVVGYDIKVLRKSGEECDANEEGFVVVKLPMPPGTLLDLWNNHERFVAGYLSQYDGYYFSGDGGYKDEDGYVFITGRVDDIINVAGHRLSTAEIEEVVSMHPAVAECAVVGVADELKGQVPFAFVVLKNDNENTALIETDLNAKVREIIGAIATIKKVQAVQRLPKTRSGKILRKLLCALVDKTSYTVPSTIDDPEIIEEIKKTLM